MTSSCRTTSMVAFVGAVILGCATPAAFASTCDLTAAKDGSCTLGSAIYSNPTNLETVGSGVINPFLTVQKNDTESGYTSDITNVNMLALDAKRNNVNTFTNTIQVGSLDTTTIGSTTYFMFLLDVNEPNNANERNILLDYLRIYTTIGSYFGDKNTAPTLAALDAALGPAKYNLGADSVLLNYDLFAGSGKGYDMLLLVDISLFGTLSATDHLVFANSFSGTGDGFEEWAYVACPPDSTSCLPPPPPPQCLPGECVPLPEPGTVYLLGLGMLGLAAMRRRLF